jgi:hypothetical protein
LTTARVDTRIEKEKQKERTRRTAPRRHAPAENPSIYATEEENNIDMGEYSRSLAIHTKRKENSVGRNEGSIDNIGKSSEAAIFTSIDRERKIR